MQNDSGCARSRYGSGLCMAGIAVAEHDGLDQATVQFLLQQSLAEEEEREQAELDQLEDDVVLTESRLLEELQRDRDEAACVTRQTWAALSRKERAAVLWFVAKKRVEKRKEKRKRSRRMRRSRRSLLKCSS